MYDIPDSFDPQVFVGRSLDVVAFAINAVTFTFEPAAVVSIQFGYSYRQGEGQSATTETIPVRTTRALELVGAEVASCRVFRRRELIIGFAGGGQLRCLESADPLESYIVQVDDREFVV